VLLILTGRRRGIGCFRTVEMNEEVDNGVTINISKSHMCGLTASDI
jgi:hypothetical protein